jgi:Domain of unknown function (DUF3806)
MSTRLRQLSSDEVAARDAGLDLAARLIGAPRPLRIDQVQALYDALLVERADNRDASIALGLAFGEQIVATSEFEWVRVSDDYGDETCVSVPGKEIFCAPISILQKRLKRRETTDLTRLRYEMIEVIQRRIDEEAVADR